MEGGWTRITNDFACSGQASRDVAICEDPNLLRVHYYKKSMSFHQDAGSEDGDGRTGARRLTDGRGRLSGDREAIKP
jgi:hypothetical protein